MSIKISRLLKAIFAIMGTYQKNNTCAFYSYDFYILDD